MCKKGVQMKLFVSLLAFLTVFSFKTDAAQSAKKVDHSSLIVISDKAREEAKLTDAQIFEQQMLEKRDAKQRTKGNGRRSAKRYGGSGSSQKASPSTRAYDGSLPPSVAHGMFVK